ncbi:MAG: murein biosynthesis integral membrane protein MurJ [Chloroflexi bacterium AL-W]|nr:murein biosynthesis integral membrane protein MurJ [Chloroflexi bacterium AL-N1]NOK70174.1 murein biosynthesis integral membrane protein MurJ [Chloroflexi bacterium AL-N10]NOK77711.1 murein biosynthesis integral membrane protein MurJ [Chloroflexi bacterium AL-N5]NOK84720.1 murein biosynthesis integral membrane protein MurJ [Chloroflexi bacterium AL-W]NOK93217.1 murein biosynthesis integral membrane protein MurJ [Chloroflexi bacterium AL-N15]
MSSTTGSPPSTPSPRRWSAFLNTFIVAGSYLLSRVLGLIRDIIIASQFGTSLDLSAYRAAFGVLDIVYLVIAGGALGSAFIPVFAAFLTKQRQEDAWRLASSVLNVILVGLLVTCVLIAIFAQPLVALTVARGFDPENQALTAQLLRMLLIQPVLLGIGGLAKATLESFDRFALPAIGSNLYNLGIIGGALLAPIFGIGIFGLVWGVIGGALLFLIIQIPGLITVGARYTPTFRLNTPGLWQVARLLGPRLFGQSAWQINLIVIISFASVVGEQAAAANAYAFQLMLLPHGLVALSLGTVLFPQLARHFADGNIDTLREIVLSGIRSVLFLALPAAVLLGMLRVPLIELLFQRGDFTGASTMLTAEALGFYAIGLAAFAASEIIVRTFYAMQDTLTPVLVVVVTVVVNITLAWLLLEFGLAGLALAFSLANVLEMIILLIISRQRLGAFGAGFWRAVGSMAIATLAVGGALLALLTVSTPQLPFLQSALIYQWPNDFAMLGLWLACAFGISSVVYGGITALFGLSEVATTWQQLQGIVARLRR